jgi:hypothetical protein
MSRKSMTPELNRFFQMFAGGEWCGWDLDAINDEFRALKAVVRAAETVEVIRVAMVIAEPPRRRELRATEMPRALLGMSRSLERLARASRGGRK